VSFPEFFRQWWPPLVRYLISQASDTHCAEDVAQETMLAARDQWEQLLTFERPDAWLFKVATRRLRRWEARARERCVLLDNLDAATGDLRMAAANDDWVHDHLDIVTAIRSLPRRQAEVVALHCLLGYTFAEVADILGVTESTAKTHLYRALEHLKQVLEPAPTTDRGLT